MLRKNHWLILCLLFAFSSCEKDVSTSFSEVAFNSKESNIVAVNIPFANGNNAISNRINSEINKVVSTSVIIRQDTSNIISIEESIKQIEKQYTSFKNDFPETHQIWEIQIDGDLMYKSNEIISIAISSYKNTGGAHGNLIISILNFDSQSGKRLSNKDLIKDFESFKSIARDCFNKAIEDPNIFFDPTIFALPQNMGYTEEGLLLLYNAYEIAPYASGTIDFTIPFEELKSQLVFNSF